MKSKDLRSVMVPIVLGMALLAAGCSENAPCNTDPSQIESARAELKTADQQVESAKTELADANQKKSSLESQIKDLPDPGDLEQQLEILKKGSGR